MTLTAPTEAPPPPSQGTPPSDPFRRQQPQSNNPPDAANPPQSSSQSSSSSATGTQPKNPASQAFMARAEKESDTPQAAPAAEQKTSATMLATMDPDTAALRLAPRLAPQPATISLGRENRECGK